MILSNMMLKRWEREVAAGQSVSHPNILNFLGLCDNPDPEYKEFVGIVLPYCKNGNLSTYLEDHPASDKLRIVRYHFKYILVYRSNLSGLLLSACFCCRSTLSIARQ